MTTATKARNNHKPPSPVAARSPEETPLTVLRNLRKTRPDLLERAIDRFHSKTEIPIGFGCWEWKGSPGHRYGRLGAGYSPVAAHRFSYELFRGPIEEPTSIDHLCKNTRCVNPNHLEAVPIKVNILRGDCPGAVNAAKTHCNRGHPFTADNTFIRKDGVRARRWCRTCKNNWRSYYREMEKYRNGLCDEEPARP